MARCCALGLTACLTLIHAEIQTQHIVDSSVKVGPVEPLMHVRLRTTPEGGGIAQVRAGPILYFDLRERATLLGGYYYTREKDDNVWNTTHRSFGGVELAAWKRKAEVDFRSLVERHTVIAAPDYTLFRNRIRISPAGKTAPYIGVEAFVDVHGLRSMRYSGGLRREITEELILDFGYFYENRHPRAGSDRHMLGTTIHWRDKSPRLDTDP